MSDKNLRQLQMQKAYKEATKRLRTFHAEEFHILLEEVYEEHGLNVRKRLTGERKRKAMLADARRVIAELGQ